LTDTLRAERTADPSEIAEAIVFLASGRSSYVTGATVARPVLHGDFRSAATVSRPSSAATARRSQRYGPLFRGKTLQVWVDAKIQKIEVCVMCFVGAAGMAIGHSTCGCE
jgi:hypothetical protein